METRTKSDSRKTARVIRPREAHTKSARRPAQAPAVPDKSEIAHQQIATLAYSYWQARGYQSGSAEEDWFRAERELRIAGNQAN